MQTSEPHRGRLIDPVHLIARDLAASRRFCEAALGALGLRPYHPDDCAAFAIDPDGNNAVHLRPARRCADTVVISF